MIAACPDEAAELVQALLPLGCQGMMMAILRKAVFDESGTHSDDFLVVAGLIGTEKQWKGFHDSFLSALDGDRLRASKFKAKTCNDPIVMQKVCQAITDNVSTGFVVSICPKDYVGATSQRFRSQHGSPYTLALKEVTSQVARWLDYGGIEDPVAYFFDSGHRNQEQASQYFSRVCLRMPKEKKKLHLSSWGFHDDDLVWSLKAADVLANQAYRMEWLNQRGPGMDILLNWLVIMRHHITTDDASNLVGQLDRLYKERKANRARWKYKTLLIEPTTKGRQ